ncbi:uncharacterized protein [Haliotis asinina]|uniref:uncharacterized protein n=1 Tax=Haliotis asinina TaxID=109174 RepID=UPI003531F939
MANVQRAEFVISQRGARQVIHQSYRYKLNRTGDTAVYWRCAQTGCKGNISTVGEFIRTVTGAHNHPPEDETSMKLISNLRKRSREETTAIQQIYNDEINNIPVEAAATVPPLCSVKSGLYRHRRKTTPALPKDLASVNIEGSWANTKDGRRFLAVNSGREDKILVFATDETLEMAQQANILYMDGTFYSCPGLWHQLYVIHSMAGGKMFPLMFCLLPDRRRETYTRLFQQLKEVTQDRVGRPLSPDVIQVDFEYPVHQAIHAEFPTTAVRGCYFHYSQCVWRKVQDLELVRAYKDNPEVGRLVRRAAALALLPAGNVQDVWVDCMNDGPIGYAKCEQFKDYIVNNWVDFGARFPIAVWNHNNTEGPRTNNHLEGWHHHLNQTVQRCHPNIFSFISTIKSLESSNRRLLAQMMHGANPPPRKRKYVQLDTRLQNLKTQLQNNQKTPLEFVDAAGRLLKLD